jgi:hypothetical protein
MARSVQWGPSLRLDDKETIMKIARALGSGLSLLFAVGLMGAGCTEEPESNQDNVVPSGVTTTYDLAALCDGNIKRHVGIDALDNAEGVVRWQGGDRDGVEWAEGEDPAQSYGQEYVEYYAVQNGKRVDTFASIDAAKPLYCFFTSKYYDFDGKNGALTQKDKDLAKELGKKENFNATFDPVLVRMKDSVNSRNAATTLVVDAMGAAKSVNDERQAACFMAAQKNKKKAASLKKACRGIDLSVEANWTKVTKLGAKIPALKETGYEDHRNMVACLAVDRLASGGVQWRSSDPRIAEKVFRANNDCSCEYSGLPDAVVGFTQGTWTSDNLPPGCRRAIVAGKEDPQLTICTIPEGEKSDLELNIDASEDLMGYCNDRFGKDIVMKAPLRAIEKKASCKSDGSAFCDAWTKNAVK